MMSMSIPAERRAVLLVHFAFILTGVVVTMLGPLVPILSSRWEISDAQAGFLFTSQFVGSTLGVALSSLLLPHRGFRAVLALGLFWMAAGVGVLGLARWPSGLAAVFFYGVGFGIAVPTGNLLISKLYQGRDAAALSLLNMSWGIGAVIGPIVIAVLIRWGRIETLYIALTVALAISGVSVVTSQIRPMSSEKLSSTAQPGQDRSMKWWTVALFAAMFFLYVGSENAFGGWVASYAKRISDPDSIWALAPSFFWITLVGGRALAPIALRFFSDRAVAIGGLIVAALGAAGLLASRHLEGSMISALVAGLGFAPVYPITISAMAREYGNRAQRIAGLLFAMAGFGAATMPWLVGLVSDRFGSLRLGLVVPLMGVALMLTIQLATSTRGDADLRAAK